MRHWLAILAICVPAAGFAASADSLASRPASAPPVLRTPVAARSVIADPAAYCESAVTAAEYSNRLPARLLGAISLTETGRVDPNSGRVRPWPWTINAEGQGQFFATAEQAIAAAKALQARGVQSIDVGCMQINLMHHPDAFASLKDAFDPALNAAYGAKFLTSLYAASHDWGQAIGAYHSETPALGDAYRVLVMARWQNGDPHAPGPRTAVYADFQQSSSAYGAFAPRSQVYGAFAPR